MNDSQLLERLDKFLAYEANWDGYGSGKFDIKTVELCKQWVADYPNFFTFVAPIADSSWQLEAYSQDLGRGKGPWLEFGPSDNPHDYWFLCGSYKDQMLDFWEEAEEGLTAEEVRAKIASFRQQSGY